MIQLIVVLILAGFFLSIVVWLIGLTSYYAYRRGYNPIVWALAAIIAMNPIFLFVVLAAAPHRRRLRLRDQYRAELDAKLAGQTGGTSTGPGRALTDATLTARPERPLDATRTYLGNE